MRVIAKAYADEPLQRVATGICGKIVYLLNPSVAVANGTTPLSGVGFPISSVYEFHLATFESLCLAWQSGDVDELARLWGTAAPFRVVEPA
jgi:hypothetical protein